VTGCVIVDALRIPFCKSDGAYKKASAVDLGVRCATALMERNPLSVHDLDGLVAGNVGCPSDAANIGRVIGLMANFPESLTAHTVARNCASGIEAVTTAVEKIRAGTGEVYLAVTTESMTQYPLIMGPKLTQFCQRMGKSRSVMGKLKTLSSLRLSFLTPRIALFEGLRDPTNGLMMGATAEGIARDFDIDRETQDQFALKSHLRALAARQNNLYDDEIIPFFNTEGQAITQDDGPRESQSMASLTKLKPVFDRRYGSVTVGNACGITDGAAALLVASGKTARKNKWPVLAKIKGFSWTGCDPRRMGLGPVSASSTLLKSQNLTFDDMGIIEVNEAFAAQVLGCLKSWEENNDVGQPTEEKLNPLGGAIALGHPVGATGGRMILTVAKQLKRNNLKYGIATLCIGGGQGGAILLENPDV
jgi:acetyl-CoA C-acetyltransferase